MLVLTTYDTADITAAVDAGAVGYLFKDTGRDREGLSSREIEVLTAVARGQGNKQVARALHISEATVKTHLLHIYAKLGVDDRTAAVTTALERGMIRLG